MNCFGVASDAGEEGRKALGRYPEIGRPVEELPPEFAEWRLNLRKNPAGCYAYEDKQGVIASIRRGREGGY